MTGQEFRYLRINYVYEFNAEFVRSSDMPVTYAFSKRWTKIRHATLLILSIFELDAIHTAEDSALAADDSFFVFGGVENV